MTDADISAAAMEVSSHAIAQYRADGVRFSCVAFSNITQDHLDFHSDFNEYFDAKARLFTQLAPPDVPVVVNRGGAGANKIIDVVQRRGMRIIETGIGAHDVSLNNVEPTPTGLRIAVEASGARFNLTVPLVGSFQAENALLAVGIVIAAGHSAREVVPLLETLKGAPGRMQHIDSVADAGVYIDYAHTPDAVATALDAIRPHARGRVIAIIGAGGDRDQAKRPLMGRAASEHADFVIVTDDNPRSEDPAMIRKQIMSGSKRAKNIGDRRTAINAGVDQLEAGDVLLIMGKGHETGQQVGGQILPFDDALEAQLAIDRRAQEVGR